MNTSLRDQLLAMKRLDDEVRAELLRDGRLFDDYAVKMQEVHIANAHALDAIINRHGWPIVSLVGLEGCRAAWLVAQHSICTPALQRKFLKLLEEAANNGDVPKRQVAYLTDRIRACEGRPQLYGTVLDWNADGELTCEIEDPVNLDSRRQEAGFTTSAADDLASQREAVEAEGGRPPRDFTGKKGKRLEWAKRVGWST